MAALSSVSLHIIPFDPIDPTGLEKLAGALCGAMGLEAEIAGSQSVPSESFDRKRRQYRSRELLAELAAWKSARVESGLTLGVTNRDIYIPGLNFIFGEADREHGVAVVSLARLGGVIEGEAALKEERLLKEAFHELGHLQGLDHCRNSNCIMFYSNCIEHTDAKGPDFCPACEQKRRPQGGNR